MRAFCSRFDHHLELQDRKLRLALPRQGSRPRVDSELTQFASSNGAIAFPEVAFEEVTTDSGQIVLTFELPEASLRADADMLLTLDWPRSTPGELQRRYTPEASRGAALSRAATEEAVQEETPERYLERVLAERQLEPSGAPARSASASRTALVKPNELQAIPNPVPIVTFEQPTIRPVRATARLSRAADKETDDRALIAEICRAAGGKLPKFNGRDVSDMCKGPK